MSHPRFAILLGLLLASPAPAAFLENERLDQPPGKPASEDVFARSPGMRILFGSYETTQVNVDAAGRNIVGDAANEPSIAVNPLNPQNIVIGWRQFNTVTSNFRQGGWAYTFDGGGSWTFPGVLTPGTFRSDPSLDVDASGTFFYESLKQNFRMDVFRSTNGGVSWSAPVPAFGGDKNWLAVDRSGGTGDGFLYGIWQLGGACCGNNVLTRSVDHGLGFQPPVTVPLLPTFGTMAVGPDGEVYASGVDGTGSTEGFVVARSTNDPDPLIPPSFHGDLVSLGGTMGFGGGPNPGGLTGQANVFVNTGQGLRRGEAYLLSSVVPGQTTLQPPDPMNVHVARREVETAAWTPPVKVNDDTVNPWLNWQWMAAGSVAPNGRIDAVWLDTRNGAGNMNIAQLFYAYSWDGGDTWSPNVAVTPSFDSSVGYPNQAKMGDYMTIVSGPAVGDVAFAATFNGEEDVYHVRVFPDCNGNGISDITDLADPSVFDCNANHVPDDCETAPVCLGAGDVAGELTLGKAAGGDLLLQWDGSCAGGDDDYAVYEGTLGSFGSRVPVSCTTGGGTSRVLTPATGDTYYLVVPSHADREGSYGRDSTGSERAPAAGACLPQVVLHCGA